MSGSLRRIYGAKREKETVLVTEDTKAADEKYEEILVALKELKTWRPTPNGSVQGGGGRNSRRFKNPFQRGRQLKCSMCDSIEHLLHECPERRKLRELLALQEEVNVANTNTEGESSVFVGK